MLFTTLQIALASLSVSLMQVQANIEPPQAERPQTVEARVKEVFADAPEMVAILKCESGLRQYDAKGNVLTSHTQDKGIAQINAVHFGEAKRLGFDVETLEGNLGFARHLYDREGSRPWVCSRIVKARG